MSKSMKSSIAVAAVVAFLGGIVFASSMNWTRILNAQSKSNKPSARDVQPLADQQNAFVSIAEHVTPAVVSIVAERDARRSDPRTRGRQVPPGFEQFFNDDPQANEQEQSGSVFIVTKDGYVLTNNHVVEGADRVTIALIDHRSFKAKVVGRDPQTDVAVLKIDGHDLPTVPLGDDAKVRVGEWALAIGNPLQLDFTVTAGIISAKGRANELRSLAKDQYSIQDFLQTDAAINPGNSGGPLVNIRGEVVGINSAIASQTGYYSGYGFAIPITLAKTVMDDIVAHGKVRRAIMGAAIADVNADDAAVSKLGSIAGVKIQGFSPPEDSPAERAGLELGDIIVKIDGKPVDRVSTLQRIVRMHQPGDVIDLEAVRYGDHKTFKVKLAEAPGDEQTVASASTRERRDDSAGVTNTVSAKKLGITVEALTPDIARAAHLTDAQQGVMVKSVERGGPAELRLGRGDLITQITFPEKTPVRTVADLQRVLAKYKEGDYVGLMVVRQSAGPAPTTTAVVNLKIGGTQ